MKKIRIILFIIILIFIKIPKLQAVYVVPLENGIYEIEWQINKNKVLDISAASTNEGANVQIWDKCNGGQQRFELTYQNGYYIIKNVNSGKVLDVKGAGKSRGTNIQQWTSNNTDAQKWKIIKENDSYTITSKCNDLYMNVANSKNTNGANIEVNSSQQKFNFKKVETVKGTRTLTDGYYYISSAIDQSKVLDISQASKLSGANVQIWQNERVAQQKFYIKYDGKGYYTIKNLNSGKMLDVANGKTERGTNVWQWTSNNTDAQKWVIKETESGYYSIISKLSGIPLEIQESKNINGTNVQINFENNSQNQKFLFIETKVGSKTIENGTYEITTKIASNMLLDVSEGSTLNGKNVQIWADTNEKQQKFELTYIGNGNYKIICKKSGKALTVSENGTAYSSNVFQSTYIEKANQLWRIERKTNNLYYIVSEFNGRYLDVAGRKP